VQPFPASLLAKISRVGPFWWALLASTTVASAVIVVWLLLNDISRNHLESLTNYENRVTEAFIQQDLILRVGDIERLAQRWVAEGGKPRETWEKDAAQYLADRPGFQAIEWVNATRDIRWAVPSEGGAGRNELDLPQDGRTRTAVSEQGEDMTPRISQPFELLHGGLGILLHVPVTREGKFDGLLVGVLSLTPWLDSVFAGKHNPEFRTQIFIADQLVYDYSELGETTNEPWITYRKNEIYGLQWTTQITPTVDFLAATHLRSSALILTLGLLLSALIGLAVCQWLTNRTRSWEIQNSADQLSTLMKNLPGMAYRTEDHNYPWPMQFVSEGCKHLSGYEQSDFDEQRVVWSELIHPEDRERVFTQRHNAIDNNAAFELFYRIKTKSDTVKWVWERGRCDFILDKKTRNIEAFISDISELKRAEFELIEEQAYSKSIVDTAAEAVITIDSSGCIESFNRAAESMFNYSLADVLERNVRMLMPQPYGTEHDGYLRRYIDTGEAHIIGTGRKIKAQRKDGSIFPIQLSISEIQHQSDRKFVGLIRDLSEEQAAEDEARQRREQLAHVDRLHLLGEMTAGIAHEINQPLTSISLFSQAGKRFLEAGSFERLPDIFDKLSQHALRAGTIIEQMQSMTRRRESKKTIVDCGELIQDIRQLAEAEARIHDIEIELDIKAKLPMVAVDEVQIQQVLLNLLRNGMEAMQSNNCSTESTILLRTAVRANGDAEISVVDSGGGVSEKVASRLFTPFSSTKDSGMGMGLSICRAIVIAHGGQLDFINNESGGATFLINLPAAERGEQNG
jgi:two-component system sensor kinase FixL